MPENNQNHSLLGGRNQAPLSDREVKRVVNTFLGLDDTVRSVRYEEGRRTVFRVANDEDEDEEYGDIVFGPDIYPGTSAANPNSHLSMRAAAAHELSHYHRWLNKTEINEIENESIDEAMTSLEAALRYFDSLDATEVRQLIADALERLRLFLSNQDEGSGAA